MRNMNVHVIHVTKYSAAIGSRQTNSSSFHQRSVDPSDSISECSVVAIPFGNRMYHVHHQIGLNELINMMYFIFDLNAYFSRYA